MTRTVFPGFDLPVELECVFSYKGALFCILQGISMKWKLQSARQGYDGENNSTQ